MNDPLPPPMNFIRPLPILPATYIVATMHTEVITASKSYDQLLLKQLLKLKMQIDY